MRSQESLVVALPLGDGLPATIADATLRDGPYIWATALSKLISGDRQCQWAMWFRAHYKHAKIAGNLDAWREAHNALLLRRKADLTRDGFRVYVEDQNSFSLTSRDGRFVIGGRPDIVATKVDAVIIEDCKTGLQRGADLAQLLVYMHLAPVALEVCHGKAVSGNLVYTEKVIEVPGERLTEEFKTIFGQTVKVVSGDTPPERTPSRRECGMCDISAIYCEDRLESSQGEDVEHDLF